MNKPTIRQKLQAFEYLLFKCIEHLSQKGYGFYRDLDDFLEKNDFGKDKCIALPFFFATATEGRRYMFMELFTAFAPLENGMIETDIASHINKCQIFDISDTNLKIKEGELKTFEKCMEEGGIYQRVYLRIDTTTAHKLDHAAKVLMYMFPYLVYFPVIAIQNYSRENDSWIIFQDSYKKARENKELYDALMPEFQKCLLNEKSRGAEEPNRLVI